MAGQALSHCAAAQHSRRIVAPAALATPPAQPQRRPVRAHSAAATPASRCRRRQLCPSALPKDEQKQQQQQRPQGQQGAGTLPAWAQRLRRSWEELDTLQRGYVVLVGVLLLVSAPRLLTLVVIGAERVVIGGLLAAEEVLLEVLLKGGALVGLAALLGLAAAGVWLFVGRGKTTR